MGSPSDIAGEHTGHDNRPFRLGPDMSVRMPSAHRYAQHVETERIWLPRLAPYLPLPIPTPLAIGKPAHGYPWLWPINRWLDGENATIERIDDLRLFARDLAKFLNRLRSIGTTDAPTPGTDNFYRGGDLAVYGAETRECIYELKNVVDVNAVDRSLGIGPQCHLVGTSRMAPWRCGRRKSPGEGREAFRPDRLWTASRRRSGVRSDHSLDISQRSEQRGVSHLPIGGGRRNLVAGTWLRALEGVTGTLGVSTNQEC